jgi:DNA polymerase-3 subunit alpha
MCGWLRYYYPLEFVTTCLNIWQDDQEKTKKIITYANKHSIKLRPIKFRYSQANYSMDKKNKSIFKGITSIKYLNSTVAEELYVLRDKQYQSYVDLLIDLTENTSCNTRQIEILIKLNFFIEFGNNKKLLDIYTKFTERYKKTHKDKTKQQRLQEINDYALAVENKKVPVEQQIISEYEYLGYGQSTYKVDHSCCIVLSIDTKYTPKLLIYHLDNGEQKEYKIYKRNFYTKPSHDNPESDPLINQYDVIQIGKIEQREKNKLVNEEWVGTGEYEDYIYGFAMIRKFQQNV